MFYLDSTHLDSHMLELAIQLSFHLCGASSDRCLQLLTVEVLNVKHIGVCLVLCCTHIFPHGFDLFKFFEKFVCLFARLENLICCVGPDFLQLLLSQEGQTLQLE